MFEVQQYGLEDQEPLFILDTTLNFTVGTLQHFFRVDMLNIFFNFTGFTVEEAVGNEKWKTKVSLISRFKGIE